MLEAGADSCSGRDWNCYGAISRAGSSNSPREQNDSAIRARCISPFGGRRWKSEVIFKAGSVADNGEGEAQMTNAGTARAAPRLAKLLRGVETRLAGVHGDLQISQIAYD